MANEEIKKDEMNPEATETANQEIPDEELDSIAGGAVYDDSGNMLTTPFNSCSQWKCRHCRTYKGTDTCPYHPKEGKRWCPDCIYVLRAELMWQCTYYRK